MRRAARPSRGGAPRVVRAMEFVHAGAGRRASAAKFMLHKPGELELARAGPATRASLGAERRGAKAQEIATLAAPDGWKSTRLAELALPAQPLLDLCTNRRLVKQVAGVRRAARAAAGGRGRRPARGDERGARATGLVPLTQVACAAERPARRRWRLSPSGTASRPPPRAHRQAVAGAPDAESGRLRLRPRTAARRRVADAEMAIAGGGREGPASGSGSSDGSPPRSSTSRRRPRRRPPSSSSAARRRPKGSCVSIDDLVSEIERAPPPRQDGPDAHAAAGPAPEEFDAQGVLQARAHDDGRRGARGRRSPPRRRRPRDGKKQRMEAASAAAAARRPARAPSPPPPMPTSQLRRCLWCGGSPPPPPPPPPEAVALGRGARARRRRRAGRGDRQNPRAAARRRLGSTCRQTSSTAVVDA